MAANSSRPLYVSALAGWARATPEAPAIFAPDCSPLSFRDLWKRIEEIGAGLQALGIGAGDVVAVSMPEGPELLVALLGIMGVAAAAALDWNLTESELYSRLAIVPVRCLWAPDAGRAGVVAQRLSVPVVFQHSRRDGLPDRPGVPAETALISSTSGTSGDRKFVPLTHENLQAVCSGAQRALGYTSRDRYLGVMPLHHVAGFRNALGQLVAGGSVIATRGFDSRLFLSWLSGFEPTWLAATSPMNREILELAKLHPESFKPQSFKPQSLKQSSLRFIRVVAGAAPALLDELESVSGIRMVVGYGLTEAAMVTHTPPDGPRKRGSVGRSVNCEVAIVDDCGNLLPPEKQGEVVVRGANVAHGYLNDPEATAQTFRGGWLHTGDLGRMDGDGDLFIMGRIKETIKRGGETIAPLEIDQTLVEHPAAAQAAAFAIPHPTLGEDVAAAIVVREGCHVTAEEIRAFLSSRLSRNKIPGAIWFVDSIPVSSTGKPIRKALSEKFPGRTGDSTGRRALTALEGRIASIWERILPIAVSQPGDDFFGLGGDSLSAARMLAAVQEEFALDNSVWERIEFFDSPTLAVLTRIVEQCMEEAKRQRTAGRRFDNVSAVFLQSGGDGPPVFFFPGADLEPPYLRHLALSLQSRQPFIALRHRLTDPRDFPELAAHAATLIRGIRARGPLVVAGHCYGGILAYETANRLIGESNGSVAIVLINAPAPGFARIKFKRYLQYLPSAAMEIVRGRGGKLAEEALRHFRFLREKGYRIGRAAGSNGGQSQGIPPARRVIREYTLPPFHGRVTHILARDNAVSARILQDPRLGWRAQLGDALEEYWISGGHISMFEEPHATALAARLQGVVEAVGA
jgi:oxalate---CoA ligase